jgi:5-methylcytosine-specific restriction endonuclease McrBC GTP-binding regulatory subunit McrB
MDHFTYASNLLNYIKTLKITEEINNWVYKGKTAQVFTTPGGKWPPEGYLFETLDKTYQFIIRSFPIKKGSYVVMESINLNRQLYNINLSDKKVFISKNGVTQLLESYNMTVGKGRKKIIDVKNEFLNQGIKGNIISEIDNTQPIWKNVLLDILQGAINRENVKKKLQNKETDTMEKTNYKESFKNWLSQNYNDKNGTNSSYLKAIEIISEINQKDVFEINDLEYLRNLYKDVLKEQKIENGKYFYEKAPSYGKNGFYSAAVKTYIEYHLLNDKKEISKMPINQILYGPPGTGKTFNTINKAISIANPKFDINNQDRQSIKREYDRLVETGQIVFTTFHQSMGYEDFIEGIKPDIKDKNVIYDIIPGIFTELCSKAKDNYAASEDKNVSHLPFEEAFSKLKDEWDEDENMQFPMKTLGKEYKIIGFTKKSIQFEKASGSTSHTLSINTLKQHYYNNKEVKKSGVGIYYPAILDKLYSYPNNEVHKKEILNYVLIIDEINRGNISQIFGELITLIEESKRLRNTEELEVVLPYSKEKFGVPSNVFIIGTMNTADRSIEALDTALRRRFCFEEMLPKTDLLSPSAMYCRLLWDYKDVEWTDAEFQEKENFLFSLLGVSQELKNERESIWEKMKIDNNKNKNDYFKHFTYTGINLENLLGTINKRIEILLDRDHMIGHSYFMGVNSFKDLRSVFKNNIIPLLQEYFYGDYEKIGMILGIGFFEELEKYDNKFFATFPTQNYPEGGNILRLKTIDENFNIINAINILLGNTSNQ